MKIKNIHVTGGNGQLGSEIQLLSSHHPEFAFSFSDIDTLNITKHEEFEKYLITNNIHLIINCAAYTNVDKSELEEDTAQEINTNAVKNMAFLSKKHNIHLIHISTDYVFDGNSCIPKKENDIKNPTSIYGITKSKGEDAILKHSNKSIIIRTSWLYSSLGNNFVKSMINYGNEKDELNVVYDQTGTPTNARDLAETIIIIAKKQINIKKYNEIFHYSNEGVTSWYDFAVFIMNYMNINCSINPIESKDFPTLATRPKYSVLNKEKIKSHYKIRIPHWQESAIECLKEINNN